MSSAAWDPVQRFERFRIEWEIPPPPPRLKIEIDNARTILRSNQSPDLPFGWSLNPYRGCTHACAYCYARAFHEFLELGAGTEFERTIRVKMDAAQLLRTALMRPSWKGERIMFSGATDCYQPLERRYALTRACLEVCTEFRNPVVIITRSPLVLRDLDLLKKLAAYEALEVNISIPIIDAKLARALEPGAPHPAARLRTIEVLSDAGIPTGVSLAPLIPGINDHAIPTALSAAKEAGARWAWTQLVRLSSPVAQVFERRLQHALPLRADTVMRRIRRSRGGKLDEAQWHSRMRGTDQTWEMAETIFEQWKKRLELENRPAPPAINPFRRPGHGTQIDLFEPSRGR